VIQGSDRVVAQSSDTRRRALHFYGQRRIDVIPLAVRPLPFERLPRTALGLDLDDGDFVLTTVGRVIPRKGLDQMLEIVAELGDPRFKLVVVGEGPERLPLTERARSLGIAGSVRFTGFVEEERKWQILAASDLYVSTALHEGFGIVFLEGMEVGLPVLCYDCGGQTDFVSDEVGRLLPAGDARRFRDAVLELAGDAELRARCGGAARRLAADYSVPRYAERYQDLYAECLRERAAKPVPA
jgi:glycosyltransferase involved in cell wall biosynthesis